MLLRVFPGKILWVSYPLMNLKLFHFAEDHINENIVRVNNIISEGIKQTNNSRIRYVDVSDILSAHFDMYSDHVHHPGPLSQMVIHELISQISLIG